MSNNQEISSNYTALLQLNVYMQNFNKNRFSWGILQLSKLPAKTAFALSLASSLIWSCLAMTSFCQKEFHSTAPGAHLEQNTTVCSKRDPSDVARNLGKKFGQEFVLQLA